MWRLPYHPSGSDDDWDGPPPPGVGYQWGLGVVLPLVLLAYGGHAIVAGEASVGGRMPLTLHGTNAVAAGVAACSAAAFLHCHYFWGNVYDGAWFAILGKIVAACGFIGGLAVVLVRNGVLGIR